MDRSRWMTWIAAAILLALIAAMYAELANPKGSPFWGVVAVLVLAAPLVLWTHGLRDVGFGVRRAVFLAAFAGSVALYGLFGPAYLHGFISGVLDLPDVPSDPLSGAVRAVAWLVMTIVLGLAFDRLERHRSRAAAQEAAAREARDQELRARLAPHFIFNTLNTLAAQIDHEPAEAKATTQKLAALFRRVIDVTRRRTVPLAEELEFVEAYLGIEQARLGARLGVRIDVPEELETVEIPPLSLHVLVENAVLHGVAGSERGGTVVVRAERVADTIRLSVTDPGDGSSTQRGSGTALDVLRQRLARPEDLRTERSADGYRVSFVWKTAPAKSEAQPS
jgi:hypothetical protein